MMFLHFESESVNLHMGVDDCYLEYDDGFCKVQVYVYGFIHLSIFLNQVHYLSLFDDGLCVLLIKDGEILTDKLK